MADARARLDRRLLWAALARRRGSAVLAVLAVAVGVSVAAALLHVSSDVTRQLTRQLRALGPNVMLVPEAAGVEIPGEGGAGASGRWLDEPLVRARLDRAGVRGAILLLASADMAGERLPLIGAELEAVQQLHPTWQLRGNPRARAWIGARAARRLGIMGGARLELAAPDGARTTRTEPVAILVAGGPEDEAVWLPLAAAQELADEPARASLVQLRIEGGAARVDAVLAGLQQGGGVRALPLHALSRAEQGLLDRMRRLMALVTLAALVAGTLSTYGVLTDLALARHKEIALLKALGASRRRIALRFGAESIALGLAGGLLGWLIGFAFAQLIGREVFHAAIGWSWTVPPIVIALALAVAAVASLGPLRLVLAIEPARVLKEE